MTDTYYIKIRGALGLYGCGCSPNDKPNICSDEEKGGMFWVQCPSCGMKTGTHRQKEDAVDVWNRCFEGIY